MSRATFHPEGDGQGALRILGLQREGGKRLVVGQFFIGHPLKPGPKFLP